MQKTQETQVRSLGQEDPLEKEMGTLHFCCLENPVDRGAWWATIYGVAKSQTQLSTENTSTQIIFSNFFNFIVSDLRLHYDLWSVGPLFHLLYQQFLAISYFPVHQRPLGPHVSNIIPGLWHPPLLYPLTAVLLNMPVSHSYFIFAASTFLQSAVVKHPSLQLRWMRSWLRHFFVLLSVLAVSNPVDHCLFPHHYFALAFVNLCWLPFFLWLIFSAAFSILMFIWVLLGCSFSHGMLTRKPHQCIGFPKAWLNESWVIKSRPGLQVLTGHQTCYDSQNLDN